MEGVTGSIPVPPTISVQNHEHFPGPPDGRRRPLTCLAPFVPSELIEIGLERSLDMPKKRPTPEQIVTLLRQIEVATSQGKTVSIACREAGISDQSYYRWRKEYGGLDLDQARRMKDLEKENGRLKRLVADLSLEKQVLKDIASGNL
jgi:putative transposase